MISLKELIDWTDYRAAPTLPAVAITFDDCYEDQFINAVPVLREFGYSATFFGVTHWIDKRSSSAPWGEIPTIPLMGPDEVRQLRKLGFEVGCHTRTHRPLRDLRPDEQQSEIALGKRELEDILSEPVRFFCYPYGQYTDIAIASLKAGGFWAAVSTKVGAVRQGDSPFILNRLCVPASASLEEFNAQLTWIPQAADIVHRVPHLDKVARVWWSQG